MARTATVERKTSETNISLTLNLDGNGKCEVANPIGFFDHMLKSFCKHGLFDLSGTLEGDLEVDQHHLIEDTGIVLGMCFAKSLGECAGIYRSGHFTLSAMRNFREFHLFPSGKTEKKQVFRRIALKIFGKHL